MPNRDVVLIGTHETVADLICQVRALGLTDPIGIQRTSLLLAFRPIGWGNVVNVTNRYGPKPSPSKSATPSRCALYCSLARFWFVSWSSEPDLRNVISSVRK